MMLRFCRRWHSFVADRECELPDGMANVLIKRGFAKQIRVNESVVIKRPPVAERVQRDGDIFADESNGKPQTRKQSR